MLGQTEFPSTKIEWLYAGPFADQSQIDSDPDRDNGHGTCMASIAVGQKDGVAKEASLKVVKVDLDKVSNKIPDPGALGFERYIDALGQVYDDIGKNNLKGKAVVSMSNGVDENSDSKNDDCAHDAYVALIDAILKLDVALATAAGQKQGSSSSGCRPNRYFDVSSNTWRKRRSRHNGSCIRGKGR